LLFFLRKENLVLSKSQIQRSIIIVIDEYMITVEMSTKNYYYESKKENKTKHSTA